MSVQAITWALSQRTGNTQGKAVLICLANYADKEAACFPGQQTIAWECEMSLRSVARWLKNLETAGFITRTRRFRVNGSRTSDSVVLNLNNLTPTTPIKPHANLTDGEKTDLPHANGGSAYRTESHPLNLKENLLPPKSSLEKRRTSSSFDSFNKPFEDFWSSWPEKNRSDNAKDRCFNSYCRILSGKPELQSEFIHAAKLYRDAMSGRRLFYKISIRGFLNERVYSAFCNNPPEIDKDGDYVIIPGTPEWGEWLGYIRKDRGEDYVKSTVRLGKYISSKRWPPGYSESLKVSKE